MVTTNLPFENWTEVLGSERLIGATLDRLTHRCKIIETKRELPASGRFEALTSQKVLRKGRVSHDSEADLPNQHVLLFWMRVNTSQ